MLNPFEKFHQGKLVFGGQIENVHQELERQSSGVKEGASGVDGEADFPKETEILARITKLVTPPDAYTPPWYAFTVIYRNDNSGSVSSSMWSLNQASDTSSGSDGVSDVKAYESSGNLNVPVDGSAIAVLRPAPGGGSWIFDWVGGVTYGIITDNASAPAYSFNEVYPTSSFSTTVAAQIEVIAGGRTGNAKAIEMYGNVNVPVGTIVMLHRGYCAGYNGTWDSNQEYYFLYAAGITARKNNANPKYGPYSQIDFIEGDNIELTVANDTLNKEINVTIGVVENPTFGDVTIINLYVTNIYVTFIEVTEINITNIYNLNYCTDINKGLIGRIPVDYWRCTDVDGTSVWLNTPVLYDFKFNAKGCVVMTATELEEFKGGCCDDTCVDDPPPPCCPGLSGSFCAYVTQHNTEVGCDICDLPDKWLLNIKVPGIINRTVVLTKSETTYCSWVMSDTEPYSSDSHSFYLNVGLLGFRLQVFALDPSVFGSYMDFLYNMTCEQLQSGFSGGSSYFSSSDGNNHPCTITLTPVWSGAPSAPAETSTSFCVEYLDDVFSGSFNLEEVDYTIEITCISVGGGEVKWQIEVSDGITTVTAYTTSAACDPLFIEFENITINGNIIDITIGEYEENCCDDGSSDPPTDPPNDCSTADDLGSGLVYNIPFGINSDNWFTVDPGTVTQVIIEKIGGTCAESSGPTDCQTWSCTIDSDESCGGLGQFVAHLDGTNDTYTFPSETGPFKVHIYSDADVSGICRLTFS